MGAVVQLLGPGDIPNVGITRDPGVRATPDDFGAQIGEGMARFGQSAVGLGSELNMIHQRMQAKLQGARDAVGSAKLDLDSNQWLNQKLEDAKQSGAVADPGFYPAFMKDVEDHHAQLIANAPQQYGLSERGTLEAQTRLLALQDHYGTAALSDSHNAAVGQLVTTLHDNANRRVEGAATNGDWHSAYDGSMQEIDAAQKNGLLSPDQVRQQQDYVAHTIGALWQQYDPEGFVKKSGIAPHVSGVERAQPGGAQSPQTQGPSPDLVDRIVGVESKGNPNAQAPTSSARGLGQFTKGTWSAFLADRHPDLVGTGHDFRTDPQLSKEAVGWYAEQNGKALSAAGIPATDGNLYLAHFLGPQGAVDMLKASSVEIAASINPSAAKANKSIFYNKDGTPKGAGDVVAWAAHKMGDSSEAAGAPASPEPADPILERIPLEQRIGMVNAAQAELVRRAADAEAARKEQERVYLGGVDDTAAFLKSGGTLSPDSPYAPDKLQANLDPQTASNVQSALDRASGIGADANAIRFASPEEIGAIQSRRGGALSTPVDFKENAQTAAGLDKMIAKRNSDILADPATYVQQDAGVQNAFAALQKVQGDTSAKPGAVQAAASAYANTSLALQQHLGVPVSAQRIMPADAGANIGAQLRTFLTQRKDANEITAGGEQAAKLLSGLEQQWGPLWPRVFGEIAKDLPAPALVAANMDAPGQAPAATRLLQAAVAGDKALESHYDPADLKTLKQSVRDTFAPFWDTLKHDPVTGPKTFQAFTDAAYSLALSYGDKDASNAYQDIITRKYSIDGTLRILTPYVTSAVEAGASAAQQGLKVGDVRLPPPRLPETREASDTAWLNSIKNFGTWVTNPDETGVQLMHNGDPVFRTNGQPFSLTWDQASHTDPSQPVAPETVPQQQPTVGVPSGQGWELTPNKRQPAMQ